MKISVHLLLIGNNANGTVVVKGNDRLGKESCRLQEVVNAHRHKDVKLKVALRSRHADSHVVAHDLNSNHGHCLTLGGVDLAGHDRGAGLVFGNADLAKTKTRAGSEPTYVVCDLHHVAGKCLNGAVCKYQLVLGGERMELVPCGLKVLTRDSGNSLGNLYVKARRGIEARANGSAAKRQLLERGKRSFKQLPVALKRGAPARDLLREGDGRCILQVGSAALHDPLVFLFKTLEGVNQKVDRGEKLILDRLNSRDVHRRRECVI